MTGRVEEEKGKGGVGRRGRDEWERTNGREEERRRGEKERRRAGGSERGEEKEKRRGKEEERKVRRRGALTRVSYFRRSPALV